jgi:hypothetical protein
MAMSIRLARAAVSRQAINLRAGPSTSLTRTLKTTSRTLRPAAQLAESEDRPSYYDNPPSSHDQHEQRLRAIDTDYPTRNPSLIRIPQPLPADVLNATDYAQSSMYPASGVLDSISMIAICLRRREHIPRAYQIFQQILLDAKGMPHRLPEAEVWARVLEGITSLGEMKPGDETWKTWRTRAEALLGRWESHNNMPRGQPALQHEGLKVYQGYLSGLLK